MRLRMNILKSAGFALLIVLGQVPARADFTTQTQSVNPSQTPPNDLIQTNWGPGTNGINNPLVFNQLNPAIGTLQSITLTMNSTIRNDYLMHFTTPATITLTTSLDPTLNTGGPTVSLFASNGTTPIFGPPATSQPPDTRSVTSTFSDWSSLISPSSPNFIAPTITNPIFTRTLTAADGALFSQFIGTGTVGLPVTSTANSSFTIDNGNGGGTVITKSDAIVTLSYSFQAIPEPSSLVLLGLGASSLVFLSRSRRFSSRLG